MRKTITTLLATTLLAASAQPAAARVMSPTCGGCIKAKASAKKSPAKAKKSPTKVKKAQRAAR